MPSRAAARSLFPTARLSGQSDREPLLGLGRGLHAAGPLVSVCVARLPRSCAVDLPLPSLCPVADPPASHAHGFDVAAPQRAQSAGIGELPLIAAPSVTACRVVSRRYRCSPLTVQRASETRIRGSLSRARWMDTGDEAVAATGGAAAATHRQRNTERES